MQWERVQPLSEPLPVACWKQGGNSSLGMGFPGLLGWMERAAMDEGSKPHHCAGGGGCHGQSCSGGWCCSMAAFPSTNPRIYSGSGHVTSHRSPKESQRVWVLPGPTARGQHQGDAQHGGPPGAALGGAAVTWSRVVLGQDTAWMMTLQDFCLLLGPSPGHELPGSPCPTQADPTKPLGAEGMDGWKMLEKLLVCLNGQCPSAWHSSWDSRSTAPFPKQGWRNHLPSLENAPPVLQIPELPP